MRTTLTRLSCVLLLTAAGCGVHEYFRAGAHHDPRDDFGPATELGSRVDAGVTFDAAAADAAADGGDPDAASLPYSGPPRIVLGDKLLSKEDVVAFIHFGHSNMAGRAYSPKGEGNYFYETDPHAWMYHVGKPPELAFEPQTAGDAKALRDHRGGPGEALLKHAIQLAPHKYFLSLGFAQTGAQCAQYLPGAVYYDSMMQAAIAVKDRVTFAAIVIMLGITETSETDQKGYPECIAQIVSAIRRDVDRPDLPVLLTDYEREASDTLAVTTAFAQAIIPEIQKVPSRVANLVLVPTDGLGMQDDHHFDYLGHKEWTRRALELMRSQGWFPWAEQPSE